jgi:uncharacterized protein (TIGR04222 family)
MENTWQSVLAYDLDKPTSEYGFSTRLAKENYWTKKFTESAIIEYKKFMYLAATSDLMVSPSEIVDIVWHQHLVFTQSYQEFCNILGKPIQHVPSTHNKVDFEKFKAAKERTLNLYQKTFGEPPHDIWNFKSMYETLNLPKANIKVRSFILFGLFVFAALCIPAYWLLRPLYVNIESKDFLFNYVLLAIGVIVLLRLYNRVQVSRILKGVHPTSFLFKLTALEVACMKSGNMDAVIIGTLNQLAKDNKISIRDKGLESAPDARGDSVEEYQALDIIKARQKVTYESLLDTLRTKPIFSNTKNALDAFQKYFVKSKKFGALFYLNFLVLGLLLMLGFIRMITGVMRDKPVTEIGILLFILLVVIVTMLARLPRKLGIRAVADFYKKNLSKLNADKSWDWNYAMHGSSMLIPAMVTLVAVNTSSDSGSSSSDSSSCGSSCSSCGGCGGGGD